MHDAGRDVSANPTARPARTTSTLSALPPHYLPFLPSAYGRLWTLALARVRLCTLPTHWEVAAVPYTSIRADIYKPPYVLVRLTPEVALDLYVLVHVCPDLSDLAFGEVADLRIGAYTG